MSANLSPLAETFTISAAFPQGCYITSVDLFFAFAATTDSNPVEVRIVETLNGYPTQNIVYGARSVVSSGITGSATSLIPVKFKFPQLVYLAPATEYAIVVVSNSLTYKLWAAVIGSKRIDNPSILITQQPALGALFKSQNGSTWTPEQLQDLTFNLNRASFNTNTIGKLTLVESPVSDMIILPPNPFKLTNGFAKILVNHPNHGLVVGMKVVYTNSTDTQFNNTFTVTKIINDDSYLIATAANQTTTNHTGGASVTTEKVIKFDRIGLPSIAINKDTNLSISAITSSDTAIGSAKIMHAGINRLGANNFIHNSINRNTTLAGASSFAITANISSVNNAVSPVFNLDYVNIGLLSNRINNPSVADVDYDVCGQTIVTGVSNVNFVAATNSITIPSTSDYTQIHKGAWIKITDSGGANDGLTGYISNIDTTNNILYITGSTLVNATGRSAVINQYLTFISETVNGGTAESKQITVPVSLTSTSTGFRVMFSANIPQSAELDLYYRTSIQTSSVKLKDTSWINSPISYRKSPNDTEYVDYAFDITSLPSFDSFQFKFVFRSTTSAYTSKIKALRIIAHA
jgi:hypothetical protein